MTAFGIFCIGFLVGWFAAALMSANREVHRPASNTMAADDGVLRHGDGTAAD